MRSHAGGIGSNFSMTVSCSPMSTGQSALLPSTLDVASLALDLEVALCPVGTEQKGTVCTACDVNFFSLNGSSCIACPDGAANQLMDVNRLGLHGLPHEAASQATGGVAVRYQAHVAACCMVSCQNITAHCWSV